MEDYIRIIFEEMDDIALEASKNKITLDETGDKFKNSFGNISNGVIYSSGIQKLDYQIKQVSKNIDKFKNIIIKEKNDFFEMEKSLSLEASNIQIPTGFQINDFLIENNYETIDLSKNDGKAINNSDYIKSNNFNFSSNIADSVLLKDISNDNFIKENDISRNFDVNRVNLKNLNLNNELNDVEMNQINNIDKVEVKDIQNTNVLSNVNDIEVYNIDSVNVNNPNVKNENINTHVNDTYNHDINNINFENLDDIDNNG